MPFWIQLSNTILSEATKTSLLIFIIRTEISSQPCALLGFKERMIFSIFSSVIWILTNAGALLVAMLGISLPVSIVVH